MLFLDPVEMSQGGSWFDETVIQSGVAMRRFMKGSPAAAGRAREARFQPNYPDIIDEEYLREQRKAVDDSKPEGFTLTPISEPGW